MRTEELWKNQVFPYADSILWASGKLTLMNSEQVAYDNGLQPHDYVVYIDPVADSSLESFFSYNTVENLVPLTALFSLASGGLWLKGGESSDGRAGWFALGVTGASPDWVAFFRASNPFVKGSLTASAFTVENNHGQAWSAPVRAPQELCSST